MQLDREPHGASCGQQEERGAPVCCRVVDEAGQVIFTSGGGQTQQSEDTDHERIE